MVFYSTFAPEVAVLAAAFCILVERQLHRQCIRYLRARPRVVARIRRAHRHRRATERATAVPVWRRGKPCRRDPEGVASGARLRARESSERGAQLARAHGRADSRSDAARGARPCRARRQRSAHGATHTSDEGLAQVGPSLAIESAPGSSTVLVAIAASSWVSEARTASSFSFESRTTCRVVVPRAVRSRSRGRIAQQVGQRRRARRGRERKGREETGPRRERLRAIAQRAKRELPSARNSIAAPKPTQVSSSFDQ